MERYHDATALQRLPDILKVDQVAQVLGVSWGVVYELMQQRKIRGVRIGRRWRIPKVYLVDYLESPPEPLPKKSPLDVRNINVERFWSFVRKGGPDDCWEWQGGRTKHAGQGRFRVGKRIEFAHRVAYTLANGSIPADMLICHTCDNPPCCNDAHLFPGTHVDNALDCSRKGRKNSKLSPEQAEDMRRDWATGMFKQREIASSYKVNINTVSRILNERTHRREEREA